MLYAWAVIATLFVVLLSPAAALALALTVRPVTATSALNTEAAALRAKPLRLNYTRRDTHTAAIHNRAHPAAEHQQAAAGAQATRIR
jgi:hypothetical protein